MLVGRQPFYGEDSAQLFEQHLRAKPPSVREFVRDCPADMDAIIQLLLAKNPDDRPFNARQVQGVMLRLEETIGSATESDSQSDVAASDVSGRARERLKQHIRVRISQTAPAEVGWRPLAVMLVAIVVVIIAASFFGR